MKRFLNASICMATTLTLCTRGVNQILKRGGSSYTPIPGEEVKLIENV